MTTFISPPCPGCGKTFTTAPWGGGWRCDECLIPFNDKGEMKPDPMIKAYRSYGHTWSESFKVRVRDTLAKRGIKV